MKKSIALAIILSNCFIIGCDTQKTPENLFHIAKVQYDNRDYGSAIVSVKNFLKNNSKDAHGRYLLGSIYLAMGDGEAAKAELLKAWKISAEYQTGLALLKAYDLLYSYEDIINLSSQIPTSNNDEKASIYALEGIALFKLNKNNLALESFDKAIAESVSSKYSRLADAYIKISKNDTLQSISILNDIIENTPYFFEAAMLQGHLQFSLKNYNSAIENFNKIASYQVKNFSLKLMLANSYVKNEQYGEADKLLNSILEQAPENAFANQLKGFINYSSQNYDLSKSYLEKAIQNGLDNPQNKLLAGVSSFRLEMYEQSYNHLKSIKANLVKNHPALKLLTIVQLKLGYNIEASDNLLLMDDISPSDFELYAQASYQLLSQGKLDEAKLINEKIGTIDSLKPQDIARKGILQLSMADIEGISNLEEALELDSNLPVARISLIMAYIESNQLTKALNQLENWINTDNNDVVNYNLLAITKFKNKDVVGAEAALKLALGIDKGNIVSLLYFADADFANKQHNDAISKFKRILDNHPSYIPALRGYHRVNKNLNNTADSSKRIFQAYSKEPNNTELTLLHSQVLLENKQIDAAIQVLEKIKKTSNLPPLYWEILGSSYIHIGKFNAAIAHYTEWTQYSPKNRQSWVNATIASEMNKDISNALNLISRGIKNFPNDEKLKLVKIHLLIKAQKFSLANNEYEQLTKSERALPVNQGIHGKILSGLGLWQEALPKLLIIYGQSQSSDNAGYIFFTYQALKEVDKSERFLQQHLKKNSQDNIMRLLWANTLLKENRNNEAYEQYTQLHKELPKNTSIINNIAWIEYLNEKYFKADEWILKALLIDKSNPAILNTAGKIKLKVKSQSVGIALLKKASEAAPANQKYKNDYQQALLNN